MRMQCKYVPLLRAKQGELFALQRLDPAIKHALLPFVDIDEAPSAKPKPLDDHLAIIAKRLAKAWGKEQEFIVDTDRIDSDLIVKDGKHYISYFCEHLAMWELKAIVTCSLDRSDKYLKAIAGDNKRSKGHLCIRIFENDIELTEDELCSRLQVLLGKVGSLRSTCDLLIDLRVIDQTRFNETLELVSKFLASEKCVSEWKSIILAGSSFPNSLKGIRADTITEFPRYDFRLWRSLASGRIKPRRIPIYGDYGIISALYSDQPDFRSANIPTKIRYATDDNWLVAKGGTTKKNGFAYFRKLAKQVIGLESFKGENFSWGDKFIADCASGKGKTGNMASWVCVDTTHHITHVVDQLSN